MIEFSNVLLWIVVLLQGLCICYLVRVQSEIRAGGQAQNVAGPAIGTEAPPFTGIDVVTGQPIESSALVGKRIGLLLITAECADCRRIVAQLARVPPPSLAGLVVYCQGTPGRCQRLLAKLDPSIPTIRDDQHDIDTIYSLRGFPAMVAIDREWQINSYRYPHQGTDVEEYLRLIHNTSDARPSDMQILAAQQIAGS